MQTPYEATRVMANPASERTQEKTRLISAPPPTTVSPAPSTAAGAGGRHGYSSESAPKTTVSPRPTPNTTAASAEPAAASAFGTAPMRGQDSRMQTQSPNPPLVSARGIEDEDTEMLEGKLNTMRTILLLNTVILAGMIVWIFVLNQHLAQTQKELNEMHAQAQTAVGQFTPALDSRLVVFEKRMDDIDLKLKAAQTEMVAGVDSKMKATEDHLVERMNTEIPAMLDKYINKKLIDVKH
jgi:hypothetical protein